MSLNRLVFGKLRIDIAVDAVPVVVDDDLNEPFATVIYLRRDAAPAGLPPVPAQVRKDSWSFVALSPSLPNYVTGSFP